jgi:hypothetical protein
MLDADATSGIARDHLGKAHAKLAASLMSPLPL